MQVLRDRRLRAVPDPASGAAAASPEAVVTDLTLASARAAGRRAVARRPSDFGAVVPRPRTPVPTGPAAQRALRRRLDERLGRPGNHLAEDAPAERFSVAIVEVAPVAADHLASPGGRERLLTALGSRLADVTRPSDLVVRPTANRFVLVLNGVRDNYGLAAARRRITDVLLRPVLIDGRPIRTTVAVGVVAAEPGETVDGILGRLGAAAVRDRRSARRLRSVPGLRSAPRPDPTA